MIIGNKTFDTKHHGYIMGILNVTPDSFSDGGKYDHYDQQAVRKWWFTGGKDLGRTDGGMVL